MLQAMSGQKVKSLSKYEKVSLPLSFHSIYLSRPIRFIYQGVMKGKLMFKILARFDINSFGNLICINVNLNCDIKREEIRETWVVKVKIWNITERFLRGNLKLESWVRFVRHSGQQHWPQEMALNMTPLTNCPTLKRTFAALEKKLCIMLCRSRNFKKTFWLDYQHNEEEKTSTRNGQFSFSLASDGFKISNTNIFRW